MYTKICTSLRKKIVMMLSPDVFNVVSNQHFWMTHAGSIISNDKDKANMLKMSST